MPKGERKTPEQRVAAHEAAAAKARSDMDKQVIPLGYILKKAKTLPASDKRILRTMLDKVVSDRGDVARLNDLFGPPV